MAEWSAEEIWRRHSDAEGKRQEIYGWVDEALAYCMPWRRRGAAGRADFNRLFDSSSLIGVTRFSNRLQREFTPAFQRWAELKAGPLIPADQAELLNRQLDVASSIVLAVLDASAFQKSSREGYGDLAIGTMALMFNEGDDRQPVHVVAAAPWELGIEEGPCGTIQNVFYLRHYPARLLPQKWPKATWPKEVQDKISDGNGQSANHMVAILQASYWDDAAQRYRIAVMVCGGGGREIAWSSERRSNPWVIPRWWTSPGNPWGFGPMLMALPDARTANKTVEFVLRAAAYQLQPPLMVLHDGVINPDRMRIAPSALIQVARTGGPMGRSIEPLDIGANMNVGQIVLQDQRQSVAKMLLDDALPPATGAVRSASEIIQRVKEMSQDSGAAFGPLNHEMVPGVFAAVLDILDKKRVTMIAWDRLQIDHLQLSVNVISPLARVQNLDDAQSIVQWLETLKAIGGDELVVHSSVVEDVGPELGQLMGVRQRMIRTKAERTRIEQATAAGAQAAANAGAPGSGQPGQPGPGPALPAPMAGGAQPAPYETQPAVVQA